MPRADGNAYKLGNQSLDVGRGLRRRPITARCQILDKRFELHATHSLVLANRSAILKGIQPVVATHAVAHLKCKSPRPIAAFACDANPLALQFFSFSASCANPTLSYPPLLRHLFRRTIIPAGNRSVSQIPRPAPLASTKSNLLVASDAHNNVTQSLRHLLINTAVPFTHRNQSHVFRRIHLREQPQPARLG